MVGLLLLLLLVLSAGLIAALMFYLIREMRSHPSQKGQFSTGDGKLLRQFLAQLRKDYPGKTEKWYWEKAQRDLPMYRLHQQNAPDARNPTAKDSRIVPFPVPSQKENNPQPEKKPEKAPPKPTVSGTVQNKLYRLVNGDHKTAERLIAKVRLSHPDRSEQWCWEKVIWDLERDRFR